MADAKLNQGYINESHESKTKKNNCMKIMTISFGSLAFMLIIGIISKILYEEGKKAGQLIRNSEDMNNPCDESLKLCRADNEICKKKTVKLLTSYTHIINIFTAF